VALRPLIRIRRDFNPNWTKLATSLVVPKMTKHLLVVLDRSLFHRFDKSERRLVGFRLASELLATDLCKLLFPERSTAVTIDVSRRWGSSYR
jgi:hypothetical protein